MKINIEPQHRLTGHKDCLYSLLADTESPFFFTAGGDGLVARWDISQAADATLAAQVSDNIYSLLHWPVDRALLLGTHTGGLHLIDLVENRELHLYRKNPAPIFGMSWSGDQLFVAHGDGFVSRWSRDGNKSLVLDFHEAAAQAALRCLAVHPSGEMLAVGSSDHSIRLINRQGEEQLQLLGHSNSVFSLLWLANGKYLLSGSRDAHLAVWETASGKLLDKIPAHLFTINHLLHLPEMGVVASAGRDKTIKLWDDKSLELLKVADYEKFPGKAHSHSVNKLAWHAASRQLLSVGDDRKFIIWQITHEK